MEKPILVPLTPRLAATLAEKRKEFAAERLDLNLPRARPERACTASRRVASEKSSVLT